MSRLRFASTFTCVALLAWAVPARAQDSDGDGVPDGADALPCDTSADGRAFSPGEAVYGSIVFEDQWPYTSDLDFNDAVLFHNIELRMRGGAVVSLHLRLSPGAIGGVYDNGLGLHLPVPRGTAASITRTAGAGSPQPVSPSAIDPELTFVVSPDLRELFGNAANQINSLPNLPEVSGSSLTVDVVFASPVALPAGLAPFDVFLFRSAASSHEIHRPEYGGTARMNTLLFGVGIDGSTGTRRFIDRQGLPFALVFPERVEYPVEAIGISSLYPSIVAFAASGGTTHTDFYRSSVQLQFAYGRAPAPPAIPTGTDRSCIRYGSCLELRNAGFTASGVYSIVRGANTYSVQCDMSAGYTLYLGGAVDNGYSTISTGCPAGLSAFEVRSPGHASALESYVASLSANGSYYYANVFAGPTVGCGGPIQRDFGWLSSPSSWHNSGVEESTLGPLDLTNNCNLTEFDPVPLDDISGFVNRGCPRCLYNRTEVIETGRAICSVNDVIPAAGASCSDLYNAGLRGNGLYAVDPDGPGGAPPRTVFCDLSTGHDFFLGAGAQSGFTSIAAGCPSGSAPFAVKSPALAAALESYVASLPSGFYWANAFVGATTCAGAPLNTDVGWLQNASTWMESGIDESTLAPLDLSCNCSLNIFDPIPLSPPSGFVNRDCGCCLYNQTERIHTGTVICSAGDNRPAAGTSCLALYNSGVRTSGFYRLDPGSGTVTAYCDMTRGDTLLLGGVARNGYQSIASSCPAGFAPYRVRSAAHASVLESFVMNVGGGTGYYLANAFMGPTQVCAANERELGWLSSPSVWNDAFIVESTLAPLDVSANCNLSKYDPVPLDARFGFVNRGCSTCMYNDTEVLELGTVVCSLNDVP